MISSIRQWMTAAAIAMAACWLVSCEQRQSEGQTITEADSLLHAAYKERNGQNAEGDATIYVPQLIGKNLNDAKRVILQNSLIMGAVNYDVEVKEGSKESESMLVYHQEPAAGKWVVEGSRVTLYLSADPSKRMTEEVEEEDFF